MILVIGLSTTVFPAPFLARHLNLFDREMNTTLNSTMEGDNKYCTSECGDNRMFHAMLALFAAMGLFEYTLPGFNDSNVMRIIKSNRRKTNYGAQRTFGAIGFAIGSLISGVASDRFSHKYLSNFTGSFITFLPFALLGLPFYLIVSKQADVARKPEKQEESKDQCTGSELFKTTLRTCFKPYNLVFLLSLFIHGVSLSFMYSFLFLHMKDKMNSTQIIMGVNIATSNIAETIMFPFTSYLIKRFGAMQCFIVGMFTNAIRFILLAYCENAWLTLPIQLLHSTGFALYFAAQIEITFAISPKEIQTTMFGIVGSLFFSISNVVGNLVGGWIYGKMGGTFLYMLIAVVTSTWSMLITIYYFRCKACKRDDS